MTRASWLQQLLLPFPPLWVTARVPSTSHLGWDAASGPLPQHSLPSLLPHAGRQHSCLLGGSVSTLFPRDGRHGCVRGGAASTSTSHTPVPAKASIRCKPSRCRSRWPGSPSDPTHITGIKELPLQHFLPSRSLSTHRPTSCMKRALRLPRRHQAPPGAWELQLLLALFFRAHPSGGVSGKHRVSTFSIPRDRPIAPNTDPGGASLVLPPFVPPGFGGVALEEPAPALAEQMLRRHMKGAEVLTPTTAPRPSSKKRATEAAREIYAK